MVDDLKLSSLADEIRALRARNGMTQDELADRSGIDLGAIKKIERGQTKRPHASTLHALSGVLGTTTDSLLSLTPRKERRAVVRSSATSRTVVRKMAEELADDPPEVTKFVDYFNVLDETRWLGEPDLIQTTTLEYSTIWLRREIFVPYEASLKYYDKAGLSLHRFFIVDTSRMNDASYSHSVRTVLTRHTMLGFQPRVLVTNDARSLSADMAISCDAIVIMDKSRGLLIEYKEGQAPIMLSTSNRAFSTRASNKFHGWWKGALSASRFLDLFGKLPDYEQRLIHDDAEIVAKTAEVLSRPK